jgi:hypothetical protein
MMTMESITSKQERQLIRLTEDAARRAVEEVLSELPLEKDATQKAVIEHGDELQAVLAPAVKKVVSAKLGEFLAEKTESFEVEKTSILIKSGGSNPYFDEVFDYWVNLWRKKLGIKNPNFAGIKPFVEHPGYRPLILPKSELINSQYIYDRSLERYVCWKYTDRSLDEVVTKNDRDPRRGAYVAWFRDRVEADEELKDLSAIKLREMNISGITLLERELKEYDHFDRTNGHLDIENMTLCSGSRYDGVGYVPRVNWVDGGMSVYWCGPRFANGGLRSRQQFIF